MRQYGVTEALQTPQMTIDRYFDNLTLMSMLILWKILAVDKHRKVAIEPALFFIDAYLAFLVQKI